MHSDYLLSAVCNRRNKRSMDNDNACGYKAVADGLGGTSWESLLESYHGAGVVLGELTWADADFLEWIAKIYGVFVRVWRFVSPSIIQVAIVYGDAKAEHVIDLLSDSEFNSGRWTDPRHFDGLALRKDDYITQNDVDRREDSWLQQPWQRRRGSKGKSKLPHMDPRSPVAKASAKLPPLRPKAPPLAPFQQFSGEDIVLTFVFFDCEEDELPTSPAATPPEDKCGGGGNKPTKEGVPVKAVPPAKGRGSARHSKAGPIEVSLGSSLFALSLCDSRHGPVGVMLAFGCIFFGHLVSSFHDGRVVISVCVRGVRFRFVGGLGAPSRRLATVEKSAVKGTSPQKRGASR